MCAELTSKLTMLCIIRKFGAEMTSLMQGKNITN